MNDKLYIHEFIDIIGQNRSKYMYHMTANFSPMAQEDRNQLCYGVWGVLGSTGRWPEVVNIWELDGFDGAAPYFRHEFGDPTMQDPRMAAVVGRAAPLRSGGNDRLLVPRRGPAPSPSCAPTACAARLYAHEHIGVRPGHVARLPRAPARARPSPVHEQYGWELAGAWETVDGRRLGVLRAVGHPTWEHWAEFEKAQRVDDDSSSWRERGSRRSTTVVGADPRWSTRRSARSSSDASRCDPTAPSRGTSDPPRPLTFVSSGAADQQLLTRLARASPCRPPAMCAPVFFGRPRRRPLRAARARRSCDRMPCRRVDSEPTASPTRAHRGDGVGDDLVEHLGHDR